MWPWARPGWRTRPLRITTRPEPWGPSGPLTLRLLWLYLMFLNSTSIISIGSSAGFRSALAVFTLTFVILFFFFLAPTILLFLQPPQPMSFTLTLNHGKQGRSNLHGRHRQQDLLPEGLLCPRRAPSNFHLQGSRATQNRRPSICEAREKTEDAVAPIFHSRLSFTHFCSTKTFLISVAGSSPSFL